MKAGDEIEVLNEVVRSGSEEGEEPEDGAWSLARIPLDVRSEGGEDDEDGDRGGQVGLVPRSYYAVSEARTFC